MNGKKNCDFKLGTQHKRDRGTERGEGEGRGRDRECHSEQNKWNKGATLKQNYNDNNKIAITSGEIT